MCPNKTPIGAANDPNCGISPAIVLQVPLLVPAVPVGAGVVEVVDAADLGHILEVGRNLEADHILPEDSRLPVGHIRHKEVGPSLLVHHILHGLELALWLAAVSVLK